MAARDRRVLLPSHHTERAQELRSSISEIQLPTKARFSKKKKKEGLELRESHIKKWRMAGQLGSEINYQRRVGRH